MSRELLTRIDGETLVKPLKCVEKMFAGDGCVRALPLIDRPGWRNLLLPPTDPKREFIPGVCTYAQLHRLAGGLYGLSRTEGGNRPFVCLGTDDKTLLLAAVLTALAGGCRLILPYAFSRQALTEVKETLAPLFYLTDRPGDLPPGAAAVTPAMLDCKTVIPAIVPDTEEPFLYLFTGGSTGKPKVWPKTPRNLLAEACYQAEHMGVTENDLFLSTVPPQHIYGLLFSVLVPFLSTSRVLNGVCTFPREILRAIRDQGATVLVSVPVHYRALKTNGLERCHLRMALSSAGLLEEEDAAFFYEKTGLEIVEIFGSTETGGIATRRRFQDKGMWVPMDPVAWKIGGGRLQVRSEYLCPTLPRDAEGFFITADRARDAGADRFTVQGRTDDIVKVGGKRVDMAVMQTKLKQISGVRDAVVVSLPSGKGRQHELAALVVTRLTEADVRRRLSLVSETYAVPKRIVVVTAIPVTSTGKYDRSGISRLLRSDKRPGNPWGRLDKEDDS